MEIIAQIAILFIEHVVANPDFPQLSGANVCDTARF